MASFYWGLFLWRKGRFPFSCFMRTGSLRKKKKLKKQQPRTDSESAPHLQLDSSRAADVSPVVSRNSQHLSSGSRERPVVCTEGKLKNNKTNKPLGTVRFGPTSRTHSAMHVRKCEMLCRKVSQLSAVRWNMVPRRYNNMSKNEQTSRHSEPLSLSPLVIQGIGCLYL